MRVALIARDKPGALHIRTETRPDHVAYLKASPAVERAGPLMDGDSQMCGSLIILSVADMAEAWVAGAPDGKAGLFASVELIAWNQVIG